MYGIKDSKLLLRWSVSKFISHFLILLSALVAIPAFGQNSVITLAMVGYNQSPGGTNAATRNDQAPHQILYASTPQFHHRMVGLMLDSQGPISLSTNSLLENRNDSSPRDWLQFVNKKANVTGWMGSAVHIKAGYGQFCQYESSIGKPAVELEQPSCAYLKAGFSF